MPTNPLPEEIYAAREKLLVDAGGDVQCYLGVRERERASERLLKPEELHSATPVDEGQPEILKMFQDYAP